jgi:hypothetical protein
MSALLYPGQTEAPTRAALYFRVSTGRQAESDLSIPDQRRQALAYCATRGWDVAIEFVEPGMGGADDRRPELQRLLDLATAGGASFDSYSSIPSAGLPGIILRWKGMCAACARPASRSGIAGADNRLEALGRHTLRGVREPKEIFALGLISPRPSRATRRALSAWRRSSLRNSGAAHVVDDLGPLREIVGIVARYGQSKIRDGEPGVESKSRRKL